MGVAPEDDDGNAASGKKSEDVPDYAPPADDSPHREKPPGARPSEKQVNFLLRLCAKAGKDPVSVITETLSYRKTPEQLDKSEMNLVIDSLKGKVNE